MFLMDPFAVLGLLPTAEPEVVEAAIRALRLKYHPDKGGDPEAFRKIEKAARCCRTGQDLPPEPPDPEALRRRLSVFKSKFGKR